MHTESVQSFEEGDTVVYPDAFTGEVKYGRIDRAYGGTFIVHTISRAEAGPSPKPFSPGRPCEIEKQPDGARVCAAHKVSLVRSDLQGDQNPLGLGHLTAWACPVSGKQFLETEGL